MLRVNLLFNRFTLLMLSLAWSPTPALAQIDLHAHLHMKPGMGHLLRGAFDQAPRSTHWSDRIYTKATATSLAEMTNETRPKLIVLSLYAHPYLSYSWKRDGFHFDRKENVRHTIDQEYSEFLKFVNDHSDHFAIARNAKEARDILKSGKTVIVLSLEGAWGTLESADDFHRWIDERGLAIVTPVHLTPDSLGNNSLMTILVSFTNSTFDFLTAVWESKGACLKKFCKSTQGFTAEGTHIVDELMKKNVWVDLAHSNEKEVQDVIAKYETLPLLITHTQLREFYPVERGLGDLEINYIRKHDGIVGLIPSEYMIPAAIKQAKEELQNSSTHSSCVSGLSVFKKTLSYAIATLGTPERVALASDINAPLNGLSPACSDVTTNSSLHDAQADLLKRGFYTYSQWNALHEFVKPDAVDVGSKSKTTWGDQNLEHFLLLWEKIRPSTLK